MASDIYDGALVKAIDLYSNNEWHDSFFIYRCNYRNMGTTPYKRIIKERGVFYAVHTSLPRKYLVSKNEIFKLRKINMNKTNRCNCCGLEFHAAYNGNESYCLRCGNSIINIIYNSFSRVVSDAIDQTKCLIKLGEL